MKVGQEQLTKPVNKQIKPSQVHFDDFSSTHSGLGAIGNPRQQRTDTLPLSARASAVLYNSSDFEGRLSPRNFPYTHHSTISHGPSHIGALITPGVSPKNANSMRMTMFAQPSEASPAVSFQQFLYEKFRQEYDECLGRQAFSTKELSLERKIVGGAFGNTAKPQYSGKHTDLRTFASSPFNRSQEPSKQKSLDKSPVPTSSYLPQQLIASKSTKFAPINATLISLEAKMKAVPFAETFKSRERHAFNTSESGLKWSSPLHGEKADGFGKPTPLRLPKLGRPDGVERTDPKPFPSASKHPKALRSIY